MEPLLAEETYATVYPLSHLLPTIKVETEMDQDQNRQINPPTSKVLSLLQTPFSESPEPPPTPLPALPAENHRIYHHHLLTLSWQYLDHAGVLEESQHNGGSATKSNLDTEYNMLLVRYRMRTPLNITKL